MNNKTFTFRTGLILILLNLLIGTSMMAQIPQEINYQAIIRNSSNELLANTLIGMRVSIIRDSVNGTTIYTETHTANTNGNGLVNVSIGKGSTSDDFSAIDWSKKAYFIKTETDLTGGSTYTITGISQVLSVPYALHAKTADSVTKMVAETDPVYATSVASSISSADTTKWNNKSDFSGNFNDLNNLPAYFDNDTTNEKQALSISGNKISISKGNTVRLPSSVITTAFVPNSNVATVTDTYLKLADLKTFTKKHDSTMIEVGVYAHLSVSSMLSDAVFFELRIDGQPSSLDNAVYVMPKTAINPGQISLAGYFPDIASGNRTLSIWVKSSDALGAGQTYINSGGWSNYLIIKEYHAATE